MLRCESLDEIVASVISGNSEDNWKQFQDMPHEQLRYLTELFPNAEPDLLLATWLQYESNFSACLDALMNLLSNQQEHRRPTIFTPRMYKWPALPTTKDHVLVFMPRDYRNALLEGYEHVCFDENQSVPRQTQTSRPPMQRRRRRNDVEDELWVDETVEEYYFSKDRGNRSHALKHDVSKLSVPAQRRYNQRLAKKQKQRENNLATTFVTEEDDDIAAFESRNKRVARVTGVAVV